MVRRQGSLCCKSRIPLLCLQKQESNILRNACSVRAKARGTGGRAVKRRLAPAAAVAAASSAESKACSLTRGGSAASAQISA